MKNKVIIMMATYNGEKYIRQQLDSIINQSYKNWELYISDDMSTDNTVKILEEYKKKDFRIKDIIFNNKKNSIHGPFANFFNIMNSVKKNNKKFDYYFYSDQDDIWEKNKIQLEINKIKRTESKYGINEPILCYSDLELMDEAGNDIYKRLSDFNNLKLDNPYNIFFSHRFIWGTTIAHNYALWDLINLYDNMPNISHDNYIGGYAAAFGRIIFLNAPLVMYRRHGKNVSGIPQSYTLTRALKKIFTKFPTLIDNHGGTYGQTLFFLKNVPYKNSKMKEMEKALRCGGKVAVNFVNKYKIVPSNNFFNRCALKIILYTKIYKKSKYFIEFM